MAATRHFEKSHFWPIQGLMIIIVSCNTSMTMFFLTQNTLVQLFLQFERSFVEIQDGRFDKLEFGSLGTYGNDSIVYTYYTCCIWVKNALVQLIEIYFAENLRWPQAAIIAIYFEACILTSAPNQVICTTYRANQTQLFTTHIALMSRRHILLICCYENVLCVCHHS